MPTLNDWSKIHLGGLYLGVITLQAHAEIGHNLDHYFTPPHSPQSFHPEVGVTTTNDGEIW